jgi:hypothetical protein
MVDTSKFTYDTPVKIKILQPGLYLPEFSTYTPFESYASIEEVINIMNRGIPVDFPQQSKEREISRKVEDLLLDYAEKQEELKKKYGNVGTNIETALDTIQEINDSKITKEEEIIEQNNHIFNMDDVTQRIARNLSADNIERLFDSDEFIDPEERLKKQTEERKSRERNLKRKKEALEQTTMETDSLRRLIQDAKFDFSQTSKRFDDIELADPKEKDLI